MVYQQDGLCLVSVYEINTTGQTLLQAILIQVLFHVLVIHSPYSRTIPVLDLSTWNLTSLVLKWSNEGTWLVQVMQQVQLCLHSIRDFSPKKPWHASKIARIGGDGQKVDHHLQEGHWNWHGEIFRPGRRGK